MRVQDPSKGGYIGIILGLCFANIGVILGLYGWYWKRKWKIL